MTNQITDYQQSDLSGMIQENTGYNGYCWTGKHEGCETVN